MRLAFSPIDESIRFLDSDTEPWSIELELQLAGHLEENRLRLAVGDALQRHPMAHVRESSTLMDGVLQWEVTDRLDVEPVRVVACPNEASLAEQRDLHLSRRTPLTASPPLRILHARRPAGDALLLNVNHAASDGVGSLRILDSIARAYRGAPDEKVAVAFGAARAFPAAMVARDVRTRLRRLSVLLDKLADLVRPPARVAADGGIALPGYGFHHIALSKDDTRALATRGHGATVNDALLTALHLAVDRWNAEHGVPCRSVSVIMPVNLRPREWREDVVGNYALFVRVRTTPRQRISATSALAAVSAQTSRVKHEGTAATLIEVLDRTRAVPLRWRRLIPDLLRLTGNRLVDTAQLTNLGRISPAPAFGDAAGDVADLWFSAPARMPLGLSVGAITVDDRLHLSFRYRHPLMGPDAAKRFAALHVAALRECAAS